jgi:hypothetical protein
MLKLLAFSLIFTNISNTLADPKGEEIAKKVEKMGEGYGGENSQMQMLLYDAQNNVIKRKMTFVSTELPSVGKKSLMEFTLPADVKGTKLLTWSHQDEDDSQWLYLKSLRRVKRIISRSKRSSFMGSEFSYEDFGSQQPEKYTHNFIKEDDKTWTLEKIPKDKSSGYSKQVVTLKKETGNAIAVDYYNLKKKLFKQATFSGFKQFKVKGKTFHRPTKAVMNNLLTRKKSEVIWDQWEVGVSNSNNKFLPGKLK